MVNTSAASPRNVTGSPVIMASIVLDKILDQVQSQNLKSSIIEKETLVSAVKECTSKEKGTVSTVDPLTVIDAFETPRLTFSVERKKYLSDEVEFTESLLV